MELGAAQWAHHATLSGHGRGRDVLPPKVVTVPAAAARPARFVGGNTPSNRAPRSRRQAVVLSTSDDGTLSPEATKSNETNGVGADNGGRQRRMGLAARR